MRYLKKFNEELKTSTYISAVKKLKAKGHKRRAKEIEEHITNMNWKEMIDEFKKWGKFEMDFKKMGDKKTGNFYMGIQFMDDPTAESIDFAKSEDDDLKIYFSLMIIPADEDTRISCSTYLSDPYFDNGFFQGDFPVIEYENEEGNLKFRGIDMAESDNKFFYSRPESARKAAVIFKKQLLACFEPGNDYDSGYTDVTNMYDKIRKTLQEEDFTLEFDYDMDDIYNDIKKIPINDLYKY